MAQLQTHQRRGGRGQAGVARHSSAVTQWPRQHFIDEHICRFSADADNPSQQSNHGVRPAFRLFF
jgi:hypothetical protein